MAESRWLGQSASEGWSDRPTTAGFRSDDRSSSSRPTAGADDYRGGGQWSDRDPSDPVLDDTAGHRATLLGIRHGSPAALRRRARETAQPEPATPPVWDDSDPTPLFTSTRFTSTAAPVPELPVVDRRDSDRQPSDLPASDDVAMSGRREREPGAFTGRRPASVPRDFDLPLPGTDRSDGADSTVDEADVKGPRVRSRRQPSGDPVPGGSHTDNSSAAKHRSSTGSGRHAVASTGRHSSP